MGYQRPREGDADRGGQPSHERQHRKRLPALAHEPVRHDGEGDRVERESHCQTQPPRPEQVELPQGTDTRQPEEGKSCQGRASTQEQARAPPVDERADGHAQQPCDDEPQGVDKGYARPPPAEGGIQRDDQHPEEVLGRAIGDDGRDAEHHHQHPALVRSLARLPTRVCFLSYAWWEDALEQGKRTTSPLCQKSTPSSRTSPKTPGAQYW